MIPTITYVRVFLDIAAARGEASSFRFSIINAAAQPRYHRGGLIPRSMKPASLSKAFLLHRHRRMRFDLDHVTFAKFLVPALLFATLFRVAESPSACHAAVNLWSSGDRNYTSSPTNDGSWYVPKFCTAKIRFRYAIRLRRGFSQASYSRGHAGNRRLG
jgi:hypothetical protein